MLQSYDIVSQNPAPISPSGLQGSLTILNTGDVTVYVTDIANGMVSNSVAVTAGGTIQWNVQTPLYAFTVDGPGKIVVSDSTIVLSNTKVNAEVTGGSLSVTNPVNVQGGGRTLAQGDVAVNAVAQVDIVGPDTGLLYYGASLDLGIAAGVAATVKWILTADDGSIMGRGTIYSSGFASPGFNGNTINATFPTTGAYPWRLSLTSSSNVTVSYKVRGVSASFPFPVTDLSVPLASGMLTLAAGVYPEITLPPSFSPYRVGFLCGSGGSVTASNYEEVINLGAWARVRPAPHVPLNYPLTTPGTLPSISPAEFQTTGSGYAARLNGVNVVGGSCFIYIAKEA